MFNAVLAVFQPCNSLKGGGKVIQPTTESIKEGFRIQRLTFVHVGTIYDRISKYVRLPIKREITVAILNVIPD